MGELNDTMVTLLLGENTAGAFGRSLAALGTKSSSVARSTIEGFSGAMKDIEETTKKLSAAEENVREKESNLEDKRDALTNATEINQAEVQKEVDQAKTELTTAESNRDALATQLKGKLNTSSESVAELTKLASGGGITSAPSDKAVEVLGQLQKEFLNNDYSDQVFSACLVELGRTNSGDTFKPLVDAIQAKIIASINNNELTTELKTLKTTLSDSGILQGGSLSEITRSGMASFANFRKSALYDFCNDNLRNLVLKDSENRTKKSMATLNIELKTLENKSVQLKTAQLIEANKTEALKTTQVGEFRKNVEACQKITDKTLQGNCLNKLFPSKLPKPASTSVADPLQTTIDALKVAVLPIQDFNLATETMNNLISEQTKLTGLPIPAKITPKLSLLLKNKRTTLSGEINTAVSKAQTDLTPGGTLHIRLKTLQDEHHDLLNELAGIKKEPARKVLVSKLQLQRAKSEDEKSNLVKLINTLKEFTSKATALIEEIKAVS